MLHCGRIDDMTIRVMYNDGRFDIVKHTSLGLLLEKNCLSRFKRSSEWVVVGRDPVRGSGGKNYHGSERRVV